MPDYRVYRLDKVRGIDFADWIEANSDDDAVAQVRAMKWGADMCEVWHKDRLVAKINSEGQLEKHNLEG